MPDNPNRKHRTPVPALLLALLLLAVLVRGLFWLDARSLPLFQQPTGDALTYVLLAEELQQDGPLAPLDQPYSRAPLYPMYLWLLGLLGIGLEGARTLQFVLGVIGVGVLWSLGKRLAGTTGAAVAGLGGAVYGPFVFFEAELLSISLAVFFLELTLLLWGRPRWAMVVGILLGLCAMAQPNFLLAGLFAVALSFLWPERSGWSTRGVVLRVALGLALLPALSLTRNLVVAGEPILISTNGGINFFIGNNPAADGTFHLPPESGLLNRPEGLFASAREIAEDASGTTLSHVQVDRHWWLRGIDYWIGQPARAWGVTLGKALLSLNNAEIPSHYDYGYIRGKIPILKILPTFGWLLPLGGVGLLLGWRRRHHHLGILFLSLLLSIIPFFITARYRLPLVVCLLPAAGLGVGEIISVRSSRVSLGVLGGAAALFALLAFFPLYSSGTSRAHMLNIEGSTLVRQGDLAGARQVFEEALEVNPTHPEVLNNLGFVLERQGDFLAAIEIYQRALNAGPAQAETYLNIEQLYRRAGQPEPALQALDQLEAMRGGRIGDVAATVAYRRGVNALSLGDTARAQTELEIAVAADPSQFGAWVSLSILYRKLGRYDESLAAARQGATLAPGSQNALTVLGQALDTSGLLTEAVDAYARAVEIGPATPELLTRVGRLLAQTGQPEPAERFLLRATRTKPYPAALWELALLYEARGQTQEAGLAYKALIQLEAPQMQDAETRLRELQARLRNDRQ